MPEKITMYGWQCPCPLPTHNPCPPLIHRTPLKNLRYLVRQASTYKIFDWMAWETWRHCEWFRPCAPSSQSITKPSSFHFCWDGWCCRGQDGKLSEGAGRSFRWLISPSACMVAVLPAIFCRIDSRQIHSECYGDQEGGEACIFGAKLPMQLKLWENCMVVYNVTSSN